MNLILLFKLLTIYIFKLTFFMTLSKKLKNTEERKSIPNVYTIHITIIFMVFKERTAGCSMNGRTDERTEE